MLWIKCGLLAVAAFSFVACSSDSGTASGGSTVQAGNISPDQIQAKDYPNVTGKIWGKWSGVVQFPPQGRRRLSASVYLYISNSQTAVRVECMDNGAVISDLAAIVPSSATATTVTFGKSMTLQKDPACSYTIPAATLPYALQSQFDTVAITFANNAVVEFARYFDGDQTRSEQMTTLPWDSGAPGMPGFPSNPGAGGMPGMGNMTLTLFAGSNCQGVARQITPGACGSVQGFLAQSAQIMGQCTSFPQPMDGGQICQSLHM